MHNGWGTLNPTITNVSIKYPFTSDEGLTLTSKLTWRTSGTLSSSSPFLALFFNIHYGISYNSGGGGSSISYDFTPLFLCVCYFKSDSSFPSHAFVPRFYSGALFSHDKWRRMTYRVLIVADNAGRVVPDRGDRSRDHDSPLRREVTLPAREIRFVHLESTGRQGICAMTYIR